MAQSPTQIITSLPSGLLAGNYVLNLQIGEKVDESNVTFGAVGPTGPIGPTGLQGPIGLAGAAGLIGPQGPIGPKGVSGTQGPTGAQGVKGDAGPIGPLGPQGTKGDLGSTGLQGAQGPQGLSLTGAQGPIGLTGPQGPQGVQGPKGNTGAGFSFQGAWSASKTYSANDIVTFADGSTYLAVPPVNTGVTPGSDTSTWQIFVAAGATGPQGLQGPKGEPGTNGTNGTNGTSGTNGTNGVGGAAGLKGDTGATGPQGPPGSGGSSSVSAAAAKGAPSVLFDRFSYTTLASLVLHPTNDGAYLVHAKAYLESSPDNATYIRVYCRTTALRNDVPGPVLQLDSAEPVLVFADQASGIGLPVPLVLDGAVNVTAGSTWTLTLSCQADVDKGLASSIRMSAIQSTSTLTQ